MKENWESKRAACGKLGGVKIKLDHKSHRELMPGREVGKFRTARGLFCCLWFVILAMMWSSAARAQTTAPAWVADIRRDVENLEQFGRENRSEVPGSVSRAAGSEGAVQSADYLAKRLTEITGRPVWRQPFLMAVPQVRESWAADPKNPQTKLALYPLAPAGAQAPALAGNEATADIVYAPGGRLEELRGKEVRGAWVAIEISAAASWQTIASLGPRGIVFLGEPQQTVEPFLQLNTNVPVGMPRFYTDDAALTHAIRHGELARLTIHVHVLWRNVTAENLLVLVPGRQNTPSGIASPWVDQLVAVQARYDASSQVLARAPGAQQALNAAAAVELARRLMQEQTRCSVLLVLTAGDEWMFRGTREFLDLMAREEEPFKTIADAETASVDAHKKLKASGELVTGLAEIAAGKFDALSHADVAQALRDELDRLTSQTEDELQQLRLSGAGGEKVIALANQKTQLSSASYAVLRHHRVAEYQSYITAAAEGALPAWSRDRDLQEQECRVRQARADIRRQIGERKAILHIELALTSGAQRFSFFTRSNFGNSTELAGRMADFGGGIRRYYDYSVAQGFADSHFDPDAILPLNSLESYFVIPRGFASDVALSRGQPAGAFATILDSSGIMDTPGDVSDRINWDNIHAQLEDLYWLLLGSREKNSLGVLVDPRFYGRADLGYNTGNQDVFVLERTLGETVPRLAAGEYLVGAEILKNDNQPLPALQGVRAADWSFTRADGSVRLVGLPRAARYSMQACQFGADGLPERVMTTRGGLSNPFELSPSQKYRVTVFAAERVDLFGLFDPRYLDQLDRVRVLDARRRDDMQQQSVYAAGAMAAVFIPPHQQWQILVARGDVTNRMLLINADDKTPDGRGFTSAQLPSPPVWQTVLDLHALNTQRKNSLESFGISSELMKELHQRASEQVRLGAQAREEQNYEAWFAHARGAWSLEAQIYTNLISTSNGVIYGVIFLLLGLIPFSFFLERLVIGATNVYRQIAWFTGIFCVMIGALWCHPAFRISSAPLMILLAFLILLLSGIVVFILFGKFEEEIAHLRGQAISAHQANLKRMSVLGAAMRLGLSNMRRRMLRTTLTLVTIALVTFTLLCFTGVSESLALSPSPVARAPENAPPGILLRGRGWRTFPDDTLTLARSLAGDGGLVAARYWHASERPENTWSLPVTSADGRTIFSANGLLGLDGNEAFFQPGDIEKTLPGFARLATGDDVILLPAELASPALRVGTDVFVLGRRVTVAGFFSNEGASHVRQLTGDDMFPLDPAAGFAQQASAQSRNQNQRTQVLEQSYHFLSPRRCAIIPASLAQSLGARLTSVMLRPAEAKDAVPLAQNLARRSAFTVWVSDGRHVSSYNAAASWQPQNLSRIWVPLLIAGVIVLNTMLGAVAERTREIHVYTSIGLAPAHVGMLFLVEAAALGTLGVVFGYIMGQGLATILSSFGMMRGVDLNYSSTSAIMTMGLVLGLVMLSSLWPARAASRLAAPSLQRDWRLPKPTGDLLAVDLPFTVNHEAASGVCAFINEFLVAITQAGSGGFTADHIQSFASRSTRGLRCRVWLAPYDLGVIQSFWLAIHDTDDPHVYEVRITLVREAGNPATWYRLNRPFLVEIRKQFLLWRQVAPPMVRQYIAQSEELFAQAEDSSPPARTADITTDKSAADAN